MNGKIVFIGAGSMTEAIIAGILNSKQVYAEDIYVTNKTNQERLRHLNHTYSVLTTTNKAAALKQGTIIVLSTKPYDMKDAIEEIKDYIRKDQLIISVIAGMSTDYIATLLEKNVPIVRAMPNTSASVGLSATAITAGKHANMTHLETATQLFNTIGSTVQVDEADMHTVTGISGSGPAFIYYFVEAMEKAAVEAGLDSEKAKELITQTVIGAGVMLKNSTDSAQVLRKKVTSKKGTTEAGIQTLDNYNFQQAIIQCINSARKRSIEIGKTK
jgi:pyrroline-5-carboxylate reductase